MKKLSLLMFSGDYDKALAGLILANSAKELDMEEEDAPTLTNFLEGAIEKGVNFYGCKLSVDVMGFKKEELIPELKIIGAKDYLKDALESDIQLFI
jgi:peroxiredoxin family protein